MNEEKIKLGETNGLHEEEKKHLLKILKKVFQVQKEMMRNKCNLNC